MVMCDSELYCLGNSALEFVVECGSLLQCV